MGMKYWFEFKLFHYVRRMRPQNNNRHETIAQLCTNLFSWDKGQQFSGHYTKYFTLIDQSEWSSLESHVISNDNYLLNNKTSEMNQILQAYLSLELESTNIMLYFYYKRVSLWVPFNGPKNADSLCLAISASYSHFQLLPHIHCTVAGPSAKPCTQVSARLQYYWNSELSHCLFSVKLRHVPPAVCHFSFWGHAGHRHSHIAAILNMWHHSKTNWQQLWPHDLPQLSGIIHLSMCCCRTPNTHTGASQ